MWKFTFTFYLFLQVNVFHFPVGRFECMCVWARTDGRGRGCVWRGRRVGGSLKNNISLYISKSVRLERNQVSVRSGPRTERVESHFKRVQSSSVVPFFFLLGQTGRAPPPRFQPNPLRLHLVLVAGGRKRGLNTCVSNICPKGGRGKIMVEDRTAHFVWWWL